MPYIEPEDREIYTDFLDELVHYLNKEFEDDLGGHLNFCVSYLMKRLWENKQRYVRANTIRGAINNALDEWYRCNIVPYEEKKRKENGDV